MGEVRQKIDDCGRSSQIAALLDCELSPDDEMELEAHIAECRACTAELNFHKSFLNELEGALEDEGTIELPENFAKVIATTAEANVGGLRRRRELVTSLAICGVIFAVIICVAAAGGGSASSGTSMFVDRVAAVVIAAGHLIYSFALGIAVVIRSLSGGLGGTTLLMAAMVAASMAALFAIAVYLGKRRSE